MYHRCYFVKVDCFMSVYRDKLYSWEPDGILRPLLITFGEGQSANTTSTNKEGKRIC